MGSYREVEGDLIALAKEGNFEVIAHGCNCFCTQKKGIAKQMVEAFSTDEFPLEDQSLKGDIRKLGNIDSQLISHAAPKPFFVVNCYTQYVWANQYPGASDKPLDYNALTLCLKKINSVFKGKKIGLPRIGCNLAGGNWTIVQDIIQATMTDCDITIVNYKR